MKKTLIIATVALLACCTPPKEAKIILSTETLPTGQCIYTVSGAKPYTFIDSAGKYTIGDRIK